jgi:hypothetical protein
LNGSLNDDAFLKEEGYNAPILRIDKIVMGDVKSFFHLWLKQETGYLPYSSTILLS